MKKNQKAFTLCHLKLIIRLGLLIWAICIYVCTGEVFSSTVFAVCAWANFAIDALLKLFPLKYESMGSQKQFKANFEPVKKRTHAKIEKPKRVIFIAILWIILNGVIAHLYFKDCIDTGVMVIISLFYAVCDMICILVYCPFQHIMGNKCCTTCRIYNWDYIMMFTPLVFIGNGFAMSLFVIGAVIFVRWEYTAFKHPERFCEDTNNSLSCGSCKETRCSRKIMRH